ncbi:MAG: hypothetical protein KIS78_13390 [Labilithrix sp.]|nr:hypothetical protein [Labilithrix sp.]MCW5833390.1 hypothetical protein [Labilithrix sp.]
MSSSHARVPAGVAALALAGCYWLTPYEDLLDGGPEAPDSGGLDARGDANDEASTGFCASIQPPPFFCADFDDGSLARWDTVNVRSPNLLAIVSDASVSPPSSLLASVPSDTTTADGVFVARALDRASAVDVDFDVHLDATDTATDVTFLARLFLGGASAALWAVPGRACVVETAPGADGGSFDVVTHVLDWTPRFGPTTEWVHVTMRLSTDGDPSLRMTVNARTTEIPLEARWTPGLGNLQLGFFQVNEPHGRTVRYDNVVVNLR